MKRGDIVLAAGKGDFAGKPRPAVVVRSNVFEEFPTVSLCPITSHLTGAELIRVPLPPGSRTGLLKSGEVEVDKIQALYSTRIETIIGGASITEMRAIDAALRRWLDL